MTRADRATLRPEFAARFGRLLEAADSGRHALAAQGALALLWHVHSTAAGFVPLSERETAAVLDIDRRTWRELARVLVAVGMLEEHRHGYTIAAARALEGTSDAIGTAGFLRTHRDTYAGTAERVRRAGVLAGRRGIFVLATLGAWEVLRVTRANWSTGVTRWATTEAGRACQVSPKTWAGYLQLLERALVIERTGTRVRVLGWQQLCWGPSWRRGRPERVATQNAPAPVDAHEQNSPELSTTKARAEGTTSPLPPAGAAPRSTAGPERLRRGEHPALPELFAALEARAPGAAFARWRRPVRAQLSHALAATHGDVAGLVHELTRRDLSTARDVPSTLGYRCSGAVEVVRARQLAQATAANLAQARAEQAAKASAADAADRRWKERVSAAAGDTWPLVLARVASDLPWARPGSPGFTAAAQRMLEAEARSRIAAAAAQLTGDDWRVNGSAGRGVHAADTRDAIPDDVLIRAVREVASQAPGDGSGSREGPR